MLALTPTAQVTIFNIAADMMAEATSDGDTARIDRALDLVDGVERLPSGQWSVPSSTGLGSYVVSRDARTCGCSDYVRRETACKHIFSVRLAQQVERLDAEAHDPTITIRVATDESIIDLWPAGEPCDLPTQCPRCHAEDTNRRHPDGLGNACISAELFGTEV